MAVNREHDAEIGGPGAPEMNDETGSDAPGAVAAGNLRAFAPRLTTLTALPHPDSEPDKGAVEGAETASASEVETGTDGRSARAQARREQRRGLILASATQVFKEKGYHATSVGDIIDGAQIARGTFYLYFTSKREIFAALSAGFLTVIRNSVRKISLDPADGEPLAQMRANFRRVIHTVLQHQDLATIVLRDDALDAEARLQLDRFYDQVIGLIGQAVRVGHRLGIARECDETIIAVSALGALKEILTRMLAGRRTGELALASAPNSEPGGHGAGEQPLAVAPPWPDPDRLADELLSFFVRGVFTQGERQASLPPPL